MAAAGMVRNQALTILRVTHHFTADTFFTAHTQDIDHVMMWVVLTGTHRKVARKILMALADSAQNQSMGLSFTIFCHIVFTILHHHIRVHIAMAALAASTTHIGTL
jgi:hypothetical protein